MNRSTSAMTFAELEERGVLKGQRYEVLQAFYRFGPGTAAEILKRAGLDGNRNLTRARVSELANGGRLVKLDERPCKVTGKQAIVWGAILRHEKPQPLPTMRVVKLTEYECQLAADVASGKRGTFSDEFTALMNKLAAANDREAS